MKTLLCLAALVAVAVSEHTPYRHPGHAYGYHGYAHQVFGFPGSDPRCHKEGDIVMDPDNRCQVLKCKEMKKKHGYHDDDKHVYKYFDVEVVKCPVVKVPAHIHHGAAVKKDEDDKPVAHYGYGHHGYPHPGYGYRLHEVDIQTAVNKYNHARYLGVHIKGEVKAVCGDYAYKPSTDCTDVQKH